VDDLKDPLPAQFIPTGTRILIALLTIVKQPGLPNLLLIEDLDHGIHPRLFQDLVEWLRLTVVRAGTQIVATTHNPYLLDCFSDDADAVLVVEKVKGESTVRSLGPSLAKLSASGGGGLPLGELYLRGFLN
jgi:predicted ATPase